MLFVLLAVKFLPNDQVSQIFSAPVCRYLLLHLKSLRYFIISNVTGDGWDQMLEFFKMMLVC
jgi:hypothetical protein